MILFLLRGAFVLLSASVTMLYVLSFQRATQDSSVDFKAVCAMLGITLGVALAIVMMDMWFRQKKLAALSGLFLGVIAGLVAAFAMSKVIDLIVMIVPFADEVANRNFIKLMEGVKVFVGLITCYLSTSLVLQTKDDFRFVIPYVEFAKQIRGNRPILLDTSVIVDGRILDIIDTHLIQGSLIVPRFVLEELHTLADSADKLKRARGRRGLEILQKLQDSRKVDLSIDHSEVEGVGVDHKLMELAKQTNARLMTNDFNLNKVASLRKVDVINLHDLARALRPVVLPGEVLRIKIVKPGEGVSQGVGYLDDGTMVVGEGAKRLIGQEVDLTVTSTLQTSAGRMIFGRCEVSSGSGGAPVEGAAGKSGMAPSIGSSNRA
jgi:uncharacterized protein YacL